MRDEIDIMVDWFCRVLMVQGVILLWIFGGWSFWTVAATISLLCLLWFDITSKL